MTYDGAMLIISVVARDYITPTHLGKYSSATAEMSWCPWYGRLCPISVIHYRSATVQSESHLTLQETNRGEASGTRDKHGIKRN